MKKKEKNHIRSIKITYKNLIMMENKLTETISLKSETKLTLTIKPSIKTLQEDKRYWPIIQKYLDERTRVEGDHKIWTGEVDPKHRRQGTTFGASPQKLLAILKGELLVNKIVKAACDVHYLMFFTL